jgi:hypothetical protein
MKLTAAQQPIFADWVREKMEHHACLLCQSNQWKIGELIHPANDLVNDELDPSHYHNRAELICQNCGHVLLFDVRFIRDWQKHEDESHSAVM